MKNVFRKPHNPLPQAEPLYVSMSDTRPFESVEQALDAQAKGDSVTADALFHEAITRYREARESPDYALGQYGAFLLEEGRHDEAQAVLGEAVTLRTDIPRIWENYLAIQAARHDVDGMVKTVDRLPTPLALSMSLYRWWYPSINSAVRDGDLVFAELLCRTARDEESARGHPEAAWAASGELGHIYERMERIDDALAEWTRAFEGGSTDATTVNRLSLTLNRLKRYDEATAVIETALSRELPASTEEKGRSCRCRG